MLFVITAVFLLLYALLILCYFYYWLKVKEFSTNVDPVTFVSVIIAARNEEEKLPRLMEALKKQSYPEKFFEIIVVDDFSTDNTQAAIQSFLSTRVHLIQPNANTEQSSKKKAIEAGVQRAKGPLIVITDADCVPQKEWLQYIF